MPEHEDELNHRVRENAQHGNPFADPAIRAALANVEVKRQLQTAALQDLLRVDEAKVESLLPTAEPEVRDELLGELIERATDKKRLDRALRLLMDFPAGDLFPYGAATQLMMSLPPSRDAEKLEIFEKAMASDGEAHSLAIGGDDFASMIVRFHNQLPPALALEAIHQVLDGSGTDKSQIALQSGTDKVSFSNLHEYRVFELLPILRQLDPDQADLIVESSQAAREELQRFPNGIQSLDPTIRDTPLKKGEYSKMRGMMGAADLSRLVQRANVADAFRSRIDAIEQMAQTDPRQAIAATATLPESADSPAAPRAEALLAIAGAAAAKDPSVARDALQEMAGSLTNVHMSSKLTFGQTPTHCAIEGIGIALRIGEPDLATKLLELGLKQAAELRSQDTDEDDPNLALKAFWPSAAVTSELIVAASHISPQLALDTVRDVSDPEVGVFSEIRLACSKLRVKCGATTVMVNKKSTQWAQM